MYTIRIVKSIKFIISIPRLAKLAVWHNIAYKFPATSINDVGTKSTHNINEARQVRYAGSCFYRATCFFLLSFLSLGLSLSLSLSLQYNASKRRAA